MTKNWRKSSHSGATNGDCVEVAIQAAEVGVRDSKNAPGPELAFPPANWQNFTTHVKAPRR